MKKMLCPCCKSPLEEGGMKPLETLEEHVCDPNGPVSHKMSYRCSDPKCLTHKFNIIWNSNGERYGGWDKDWKEKFDDRNFIGENDAPFGTHCRKMNVEISKRGVKGERELFTINGIKFLQEFHYKADENGNVLGRSWRIVKWKKDVGGWISYEFPFISFLHTVREGFRRGPAVLKRQKDAIKEGKKYKMHGFESLYFQLERWDKRPYRVWGVRVNRMFFPSIAKEISLVRTR